MSEKLDNLQGLFISPPAMMATPASDNSILFQNEDVCVLHPDDSSKGIVVYHGFNKEWEDTINAQGLVLGHAFKTGGRTIYHPYNFFRAPAYSNDGIPTPSNPSFEEVNRNYAAKMYPYDKHRGFFCIRIDPSKTFVYLSESRVVYFGTRMWENSRLSLADYQKLCHENEGRKGAHYHAISGVRSDFTGADMVYAPPERNGEILVPCTIPPEWRVRLRPKPTLSAAALGLSLETPRIAPMIEICCDDDKEKIDL